MRELKRSSIGIEDDSPGPSWTYMLLVFPHGIYFHNCVFSEQDFEINRFESMRPRTQVPTHGKGEVMMVWHALWHIAVTGTCTLLDLWKSSKYVVISRANGYKFNFCIPAGVNMSM